MHKEMQQKLMGIIAQTFPIRGAYNFCNMSYPGSLWTFTIGSKKYHPIKDFDPKRVLASGLEFQYYNANLHTASFALPSFMQKNLSDSINL